MFRKGIYFQSNSGGGDGGGNSSSSNNNNSSNSNGDGGELTFDSWFEKQDDKVKGLLDGHTKGLKSALENERGSRKDLEKQMRDLASKAEKGSDAEKQLTQMADKLSESDRKADFYDAAHRAGVSNLKLAYTVAVSEDLFDKKGNVDFGKMKTAFPELFGAKKAPSGNAAEGTEGSSNVAADMNARIRRASGRVTS